MFLQQYHAGHEIVICDVLTNGTMIWDHNHRHFRLSNHLKLSKHVFFSFRELLVNLKEPSFVKLLTHFN